MPPATPDASGLGEFAEALAGLREWASARAGLPVVHAAAPSPGPGLVVLLHPLGIAPAPPDASGPAAARMVVAAQLTATVLVTALGAPAEAAAAVTADLALDALAGGRRVDPQGPDAHVWAGLGLTPSPAFVVELPVRRLLSPAQAPPVRAPLRVVPTTLRRLHGRVVAGDGTPLANSAVALAAGGAPTTTDARGRFVLDAAVPPEDAVRLLVAARGRRAVLAVRPSVDGDVGDLMLLGLPGVPAPQPEPAPAP